MGGTYVKSHVKGSDKTQDDQSKADIAANNAQRRPPWDVMKRSATFVPGIPEADVCKTDTTPGEEVAQPRQGKKPVEDITTNRSFVNECQKPKADLQDDGRNRASPLVDVG
jgi:hypothetical protein